ncbi:excisionase family DNA-binding protein [Caldisericum sp.]|uniref:excisionase family DNA-binding protein n=1 Tax=Caldisericum sp. TaxID=2499687 RepID=UPI003D097585
MLDQVQKEKFLRLKEIYTKLHSIEDILMNIERLVKEIKAELKIELSNSDENRSYYSISEAAELIGLHPGTVWKKVREGEIPAKRLGKKYFIPADFVHSEVVKNVDDKFSKNQKKF